MEKLSKLRKLQQSALLSILAIRSYYRLFHSLLLWPTRILCNSRALYKIYKEGANSAFRLAFKGKSEFLGLYYDFATILIGKIRLPDLLGPPMTPS